MSHSSFGLQWGHTRGYANILSDNQAGINGSSWLIQEIKVLAFSGVAYGDNEPEKICIVDSANNSLWFTRREDGSYRSQFRTQDTMVLDGARAEFVWIDAQGNRMAFYDNSLANSAFLSGKLKAVINKYGWRTAFTHDVYGRLIQMDQEHEGQSCRFSYAYHTHGLSAGYLASVRMEVNHTPVQRALYGYFEGGTAGTQGDLIEVTIEAYDAISQIWQATTHKHYRYYTSASSSGFVHGLKYAIRAAAYQKMVADGFDPETAPEAILAQYADYHFLYDSAKRVRSEILHGGRKEITFTYVTNADEPVMAAVNEWYTKTTEALPDGTRRRIYSNKAGLVILKILEQTATGDKWYEYAQFNAEFRVALSAASFAVASVTEPGSSGSLIVTLKSNAGALLEQKFYVTTNPATGAVKGLLEQVTLKEGTAGTPSTLRKLEYSIREAFGHVIYPVSAETVYPVAQSTATANRTTYSYTWHTDAAGVQTFAVKQKTTTYPVISAAQHGTGIAEQAQEYYDSFGLLTWMKDPRGIITFQAYDLVSSSLSQIIQDVNTGLMSGVPAGWSTAPGFGLHAITDIVNDSLGRQQRVLLPAIEIDPATVDATGSAPLWVRPVNYAFYRDVQHQVWQAQGWFTSESEGASWHITGPVTLTQMDASDRALQEIKAKPACACGPLGPDTFGRGGQWPAQTEWTSWKQNELDPWGRILAVNIYHSIPASGPGAEGANYNTQRYQYDVMGLLRRAVSPGGTINRSMLDARGLLVATWIGTDDAGATDNDPSGGGNPANNMKPVWLGEYDNGNAGGDGNLTQVTEPTNDTSGDNRITTNAYDYRDLVISVTVNDGTTAFITTSAYDNLDRLTLQARFHTSVTTANRTHENTTAYDAQGQVYEEKRFYVNANGTLGDSIITGTWYDPNGNAIKQKQPGAKVVTKTVFDSMDRPAIVYQVAEAAATAGSNTNNVSLDIVIEETRNTYNAAGQQISTSNRARFDGATGTGALKGPNGAEPKSRDSFTADYLDPIGRLRFTADFGTNGGAAFVRPGLHPEPSDTVLVEEQRYAADGDVFAVIAADGTVVITRRDAAGRQIETIENAVLPLAEPGSEGEANSRICQYQYAPDGGMARLIAYNNATGDQVTTWAYGSTLANSGVARSDLAVSTTVPAGETERLTYNRQGEASTYTDANGNVHSYRRDKMGRLTDDGVTTLASGVDGLVRRISTSYDNRGRVEYLTSGSDPAPATGSVINQVHLTYNGIDCLIGDAQSHSGAADSGTPEVAYQCTGAQNNILRRTGMTYPNGRSIAYEFGAAGGIDDVLNRVQSVHDDLTALAEYQFVGLAMPAITTIHAANIQRRWKKETGAPNGDAGDPYTGYDRFGRLEQTLWRKVGGSLDALVNVQWGYNRASQKIWRQNGLAPVSAHQDQHFAYDGLNQVTQRQQGLLNVNRTAVGGIPAVQENFDYDPSGNWEHYQQKANGTNQIDQGRVNNRNNQITQIYPDSAATKHPGYDANGNMVEVPTGDALDGTSRKMIWDAWNRLRKVQNAQGTTVAQYQYDGRFRRTIATDSNSTRHFYYDNQWRSIEERRGSSVDPDRQYVWNPADRWELILRDRSPTNNGVLSERLCSLKDDADVVAVCDADGNVVEQFAYSAFGKTSFFNAAFVPISASSYQWNLLFHCEFTDPITGWTDYGFRYYSPPLGRWISVDPIGDPEQNNLYGYVGNDPSNNLDYIGLWGWRDVAGFVPVLGSVLDAVDAYKAGNYGAMAGHIGLAALDALGAGAITKGLKVGTMAWKHRKVISQIRKSTSNWDSMRNALQKAGAIAKNSKSTARKDWLTTDHIFVKQKQKASHWLTNHPANLQINVTQSLNSKFEHMTKLQRLSKVPGWMKLGAAGVTSWVTGMFVNNPSKCP